MGDSRVLAYLSLGTWGISRGFVNPRWQPLFMQRSLGNLKSKMAAVVTTRIYGYFCAHVQDGGDERDKVFISVLSILIQINTSINLRYCFRKLNTCSARWRDIKCFTRV